MFKHHAFGLASTFLITTLICGVVTLLATLLLPHVALANLVMLFLLSVFFIAVWLGSYAGGWAAFLSVALFDFFCVPPRFSFAVDDVQYLMTFVVMLLVALVTGQLAALLKQQVSISQQRLTDTEALYQLASALSGVLKANEVATMVADFFQQVLHVESAILVPVQEDSAQEDAFEEDLVALAKHQVWFEPHMAWAAYQNETGQWLSEPEGIYYLPLKGSTRNRGVLVLAMPEKGAGFQARAFALSRTVASLVAITIERLHYVEVANQTELQMKTERLRSSILSSLSHDLRTPLTVMVGMTDALLSAKPSLNDNQADVVRTLHQQSLKLSGMVTNLLEIARLHTGEVMLRKEWQPLEEVIGASIQMLDQALSQHVVEVMLPEDLPALSFDAVLIERVFYNLIENAAKYSPVGSRILISAQMQGDKVLVSVSDAGAGIPAHQLHAVFEMFIRAQNPEQSPEQSIVGSGMGLAICKAIIEAHQGHIEAENLPNGGTCVRFSLPLGHPPQLNAALLLEEPI